MKASLVITARRGEVLILSSTASSSKAENSERQAGSILVLPLPTGFDAGTDCDDDSTGYYGDDTHPGAAELESDPTLCMRDYDNDGYQDLFIASGHVLDNIALFDQSTSYEQQNMLLRNQGPDQQGRYRFADVSDRSGAGMLLKRASRGTAFGDYDDDGRMQVGALGEGVIDHAMPMNLLNRGGYNGYFSVEVIHQPGSDADADGVLRQYAEEFRRLAEQCPS